MKYITKIHPSKKFCIQFDKNKNPIVLYLFAETTRIPLIDRLVIFEKPEYYLLPKLPKGKFSDTWGMDYSIDLHCFSKENYPPLVFTGNNVELYSSKGAPNLTLILSIGQNLYGIREASFGEHHGYLLVRNNEPRKYHDKNYDIHEHKEMYDHQFDNVGVSDYRKFNPKTKDIQSAEEME